MSGDDDAAAAKKKNDDDDGGGGTPCWMRKGAGSGDVAAVRKCELALVEHQAEALQAQMDMEAASNETLLRVFVIVRAMLVRLGRVCYGGTAINNLLPKREQFYDQAADVPDYDAYSPDAMGDARETVDTLQRVGITNVEARAGVHVGTYKVFANAVAVLDITQMPPDVFRCVQATAVPDAKDGLLYCNPFYLRIGVHAELARPRGDVSRWSKIVKRLALLDDAYPLSDAAAAARLEETLRAASATSAAAVAPPPPICNAAAVVAADGRQQLLQPMRGEVAALAAQVLAAQGGVFAGGLAYAVYDELDRRSSGDGKKRAEELVCATAAQSAYDAPLLDVLVVDLPAAAGALAAALGCARSAGSARRAAAAVVARQTIAAMLADPSTSSDVTPTQLCAPNEFGGRLLMYPAVPDFIGQRVEYIARDGARVFAVYHTGEVCAPYSETAFTHAMALKAFGPACGGSNCMMGKAVLPRRVRVANLDVAVTLLGRIAFVPSARRADALGSTRRLLAVFARHALEQRAPWARFQLPCAGEQYGLPELRQEKTEAKATLQRLNIKFGHPAYDRWFFKYEGAKKTENKGQQQQQNSGSKRKRADQEEEEGEEEANAASPATARTKRRYRRRAAAPPTARRQRRTAQRTARPRKQKAAPGDPFFWLY